jgi:hypothetical protein
MLQGHGRRRSPSTSALPSLQKWNQHAFIELFFKMILEIEFPNSAGSAYVFLTVGSDGRSISGERRNRRNGRLEREYRLTTFKAREYV